VTERGDEGFARVKEMTNRIGTDRIQKVYSALFRFQLDQMVGTRLVA